jgi:hypothetical protein
MTAGAQRKKGRASARALDPLHHAGLAVLVKAFLHVAESAILDPRPEVASMARRILAWGEGGCKERIDRELGLVARGKVTPGVAVADAFRDERLRYLWRAHPLYAALPPSPASRAISLNWDAFRQRSTPPTSEPDLSFHLMAESQCYRVGSKRIEQILKMET